MYTIKNYKTGEEIKKAFLDKEEIKCMTKESGFVILEGPHFPERHVWYANAYLENGIVKTLEVW